MAIVDSNVWFFDNGVSKHVTSHKGLFSSLNLALVGSTIMCANKSSYLVKGVGKIFLVVANGSTFMLTDELYVPWIKKNLLSIFAIAKFVLVVKFVDDRFIVHDLNNAAIIVAFGSL